jgi:hypothetical protein
MKMTIYGTSHFVSMNAAVVYYRDYGFDLEDVRRKLIDGEIHIGPPTVKSGERLFLINKINVRPRAFRGAANAARYGCRYAIKGE